MMDWQARPISVASDRTLIGDTTVPETIEIDGATSNLKNIGQEIRQCGYDIILRNTFLNWRDAKMVTIIVEEAYELKFPGYRFGKVSHIL